MSRDILSDVLRSVRLRGVLYFYVNGTRDWAAEAPPSREIAAAVIPGAEHVMEYHAVVSGGCWAAVVGQSPVRLETGDIVLFPHGDPHVVSSAAGMRAPPDPPGYFERKQHRAPFALHVDVREGQAGMVSDHPRNTTLVCGFLGCDLRPFNPLIASLPRLMHIRKDSRQDWTTQLMQRAAAESKNRRPGGDAMLERLSEMTFIEAVSRYLGTLPEDSRGWLAGLRDRFVGRALTLMHEAPAFEWTVEELGRRVGVPVEFVGYDSPGKMADAGKAGAWDIAFFAAEPSRAADIAFTAAYLEIEATYLVPAGSPLRSCCHTSVDSLLLGTLASIGPMRAASSCLSNI